MIIRICYFTQKGQETVDRLIEKSEDLVAVVRNPESTLQEWTEEGFAKHLPILYVGACGIAVRTIAPFVKDKLVDSPVLVMDELGEYVIPILSGHMGGANELARKIADRMGATAVITTATDLEKKFSVDVFAKENGLRIWNRDGIRTVSSKLLRGEKVTVAIDESIMSNTNECLLETLNEKDIAAMEEADASSMSGFPEELELVPGDAPFADIRIVADMKNEDAKIECDKSDNNKSDSVKTDSEKKCDEKNGNEKGEQSILLIAKKYVLGIGCRKGKSFEELKAFVTKHCPFSIEQDCVGIASIDLKKQEIGLLELSAYYHLPFLTYSAEELKEVPGEFSNSEFVAEVTGVSNVCECSAIKAAGEDGELIIHKIAEDGMTLAVAERKTCIHTWETGESH